MIKPLTSLRFIFAIMVFSSHLVNFIGKSDLYNSIFSEGFIGVSFFFILSGFILSYNYKNRLIDYSGFKTFYISRIARIYPLHIICLLIAVVLSVKSIFINPLIYFCKFIINFFLLQSLIPIKDFYFSFNGPSWSISDEIFFYSLFPFIIFLFNKSKKMIIFLFILVLLIPLFIYNNVGGIKNLNLYVNPFLRISEFIIGIIMCYIFSSNFFKKIKRSKLIFTFLEFFSIILFFVFFAFHSFISLYYKIYGYYWFSMSSIIFIFSFQAGYFSKMLEKKIFILLGEISFSFYLIHQLIIKITFLINKKFLHLNNNVLLISIILIISLIASYYLYIKIELPSNKFIKNKLLNKH